ncbi:hypothetical protein E2R68_06650 [Psychromonas sp. RZ22]|uniref:hypothetical protein n=1 Tax=Psychromonas algarum TaxID=2555643 RepID=UPI00106742C7|nr:hypothetical protein [Psychromonas sp. RZ22]TEW54846.1 hypothetical protein E2R68_06650 [Psychromonas sp. RZ22]
MKNTMFKNYIMKASIISLLGLFTVSALAAESDDKKVSTWNDMSDPTAIYSNASIGGGTEGVDLSGTYGGYLSGVYKQRFTVAAKHDLDYYEANYLLLNSASESGLTFNSTWDRDLRLDHVDYRGIDDLNVGFFAKLGFLDKHLNFYPQVSIGYMWADEMSDTTYVKLDATTRYTFNHMFWVGITPTFKHSMKGVDIDEWATSIDAGMQLSDAFGLSVSANNDHEYWGQITFAF